MHMNRQVYSNWVHNYEVRVDVPDSFPIHIEARIPIHFRYQPVADGKEFTNVTLSNVPQVYYDCKHRPLKEFSKTNLNWKGFKNLLDEDHKAPSPVHVMIPNGRSEDLFEVKIVTLASTLGGFAFLTILMVFKSME